MKIEWSHTYAEAFDFLPASGRASGQDNFTSQGGQLAQKWNEMGQREPVLGDEYDNLPLSLPHA